MQPVEKQSPYLGRAAILFYTAFGLLWFTAYTCSSG